MAEQALERSEQRHARFVDLVSAGIYEFDVRKGAFTYLNENLRKALELGDKDAADFDLAQFLDEGGIRKYRSRMARYGRGEEVAPVEEYKILRPNGDTVWIQLTNTLVPGENGPMIMGVAQNINERKELELALEATNRQMEQVHASIPSVLFRVSVRGVRGKVMYCTENVLDLTGYTCKEIQSNPGVFAQILPLEDIRRLNAATQIALVENKPVALEFRVRKKRGQEIWVSLYMTLESVELDHLVYSGTCSDVTEKKKMELDLERTRNEHHRLVETASLGIATITAQGIIKSVNPKMCEISGYDRTELQGISLSQHPGLLLDEHTRHISEELASLPPGESVNPVRFPWRHKSGELRWGEAYWNRLPGEKDESTYQVITADITERVVMEEQEADRKQELDFLFETAVTFLSIGDESTLFKLLADLVYQKNPHAVSLVVSVSDDLSRLTIEAIRLKNQSMLRKGKELMGRALTGMSFNTSAETYQKHQPGRFRQKHRNLYDLAQKQVPRAVTEKLENLIGLGEIYQLDLSLDHTILGGVVVLVPGGETLHHRDSLELIFRKASETLVRIRASRTRDLNEHLYRSLAESSGDWILRFDRNFCHVYVNQAVARHFGKPKEELIGLHVRDLYLPEYTDLIRGEIRKVFQTGEASKCEISLHFRDQLEFYEWRLHPEPDPGTSRVAHVLVNARNITAAKREEGLLLDAIAGKNRLYSILSHDLKTPYNSQLGFLKILHEKYEDLSDDQRREYLEIVRDSVSRSYQLINSVLHWAKGYESPGDIRPVHFNAQAVVDSVGALLEASLREKEIRLHLDAPGQLLLYADFNIVQTVLRNLLSNAIRFSHPGSEIRVVVRSQRKEIRFEVRDNGAGMDPDEVSAAFDKHLHSSGPLDPGNHGVGLQFSKDLIEAQGGRIWIQSRKGKGTSVFFSFPVRKV